MNPYSIDIALSVQQPWAWLIYQGFKPVENRTWAAKHRGPFLIHAGKKPDTSFPYTWAERLIGRPVPRDLPHGGIVGQAKLVDCVAEHPSPFFFGPWGFVIEDAAPVAFTPVRGQLLFFRPDFNRIPKPTAPKPPQGDLFND